ncbi:hypothetical protein AAG570_001550 [Ranatra chinensis]|uniref:Uncharacterized protein n=1 Tax=Ranatra chinensis TaxID=642074 RepID=A0ABD0YKW7_9HEMI
MFEKNTKQETTEIGGKVPGRLLAGRRPSSGESGGCATPGDRAGRPPPSQSSPPYMAKTQPSHIKFTVGLWQIDIDKPPFKLQHDGYGSVESPPYRSQCPPPRHVSNRTIHHVLIIPTVHENVLSRFKSLCAKPENHPNLVANALASITYSLEPFLQTKETLALRLNLNK